MSQLSPFIRAFRSLSTALDEAGCRAMDKSRIVRNDGNVEGAGRLTGAAFLLGSISEALEASAVDLEQQIVRDITGGNAGS